jgi:hypothetical protein
MIAGYCTSKVLDARERKGVKENPSKMRLEAQNEELVNVFIYLYTYT